ncbi:MAG: hypothetical protein KME22_10200 [Hassallia sp. WJT32-NPBG1]|jgi:hypothetical protein|nr:hypothetical protein [Hassallia sp. WJT32-NPBG1]
MTDTTREKVILGIKQGLTESLLADRDAEIAKLKQELRQIREQQILAHSKSLFRAYCMFLWVRQKGVGSIKFYSNRCKMLCWEIVNHGLEFEIHEKLIQRAYAARTKDSPGTFEDEFFADNVLITGFEGYKGRWKDRALRDDATCSYFFRLVEHVE